MSIRNDGAESKARGWRGIGLIAITYVYFLIFAQFAFLNRLGQLGIAEAHLQLVMAAMAIGGICWSLFAAARFVETKPQATLQFSMLTCGLAALCTLLPLNLPASIAIAFLIGSGLGALTVSLVSNLRLWIGAGNVLIKIGIGTGLGYFLCNVPELFRASPQVQAVTAACLCAVGILIASKIETEPDAAPVDSDAQPSSLALVVIAFTALVWLDSAAFFIIQNTPALKAGTWQGTLHLWDNAVIHLAAAVLSGFLIRKAGLRSVLVLSVLALSIACLLLHQPGQVAAASLFYPVGVSFYSVALVAYPSFLAPALPQKTRAMQAGLIYAIAGWFGSAMGIGMAQHLRQVPLWFVVLAALLVLGPAVLAVVRGHPREIGLAGVALACALCLRLLVTSSSSSPAAAQALTASERGRKVYIAEGCIHCHSQYVRPDTPDVVMWGPAESLEELRSQRPPLIGNRRQGPDLSQVGGRRSPLWLKAHFLNPGEVSHASFMPSYAYLFQGSTRGDDLVSYLVSLKSPRYAKHVLMEQGWIASSISMATADPQQGAPLYAQYCATCHEPDGATRRAWAGDFKRLPPDLRHGPLMHVQGSDPSDERLLSLSRIIKFGIPETDMPGHEYLSDHDVASLALWLNQAMAHPKQFAHIDSKPGDTP